MEKIHLLKDNQWERIKGLNQVEINQGGLEDLVLNCTSNEQ